MYKGVVIGQQRMDLIVDRKVIVEVKPTERLHPSARRQLLGYVKATRFDIGLLLHFGPQPAFNRLVCTFRLVVSTRSSLPAA